MADTTTFLQNGYNGEVLEDLISYTAQGNDTFREGLIHIKSGIQHKYTLPAIKLGDIIQDNVPTPTSNHGKKGENGENEYTFTERYLEPSDFMIYLEFNPRDYEKYWKFAQPDGNLVFRELDPKIQATMLRLLMDKKTSTSEMLSGRRLKVVRQMPVSLLRQILFKSAEVKKNISTASLNESLIMSMPRMLQLSRGDSVSCPAIRN